MQPSTVADSSFAPLVEEEEEGAEVESGQRSLAATSGGMVRDFECWRVARIPSVRMAHAYAENKKINVTYESNLIIRADLNKNR